MGLNVKQPCYIYFIYMFHSKTTEVASFSDLWHQRAVYTDNNQLFTKYTCGCDLTSSGDSESSWTEAERLSSQTEPSSESSADSLESLSPEHGRSARIWTCNHVRASCAHAHTHDSNPTKKAASLSAAPGSGALCSNCNSSVTFHLTDVHQDWRTRARCCCGLSWRMTSPQWEQWCHRLLM